MGRFSQAVASLQRAAKFWADPPNSPFADNAELVVALLSVGDGDGARAVANDAVLRTSPWPRPFGEALYGKGAVEIADGRFEDAIATLEEGANGDLSSAP